MPLQKRIKTLSWIPEPIEEHPVMPPRSSQTRSPLDPFDFSDAGTAITALTDPDIQTDVVDEPDEADEMEIEVIEAFHSKGSSLLEQKRYEPARVQLLKALESIRGLPLKRRDTDTLTDMQFQLALCSYHIPNLDEAETQLFKVTQMPPTDSTDPSAQHKESVKRCEASHLLAAVSLRQGKFDQALSFCKKAAVGRRKVLGKDKSYFESVFLMAEIYDELRLHEDAAVRREMIPADTLKELVKVQDQFPLKKQDRQFPPSEVDARDPNYLTLIQKAADARLSPVLSASSQTIPRHYAHDCSRSGSETAESPIMAEPLRTGSVSSNLSASPTQGSTRTRRSLWSRLSPRHTFSQSSSAPQQPPPVHEELQLPGSALSPLSTSPSEEPRRTSDSAISTSRRADSTTSLRQSQTFVEWAKQLRDEQEKEKDPRNVRREEEEVSWPGLN